MSERGKVRFTSQVMTWHLQKVHPLAALQGFQPLKISSFAPIDKRLARHQISI
jgi:hypothetical protein